MDGGVSYRLAILGSGGGSIAEGAKVAAALTTVLQRRATPAAISVDNGTEFVSKATDAWAYAHGVRLDFIRPGRPVENAFIETFNGRLRDECLNSHVFGSVAEAQSLFDAWRRLQSGPTA
jgi:putative transposase